MIAWFCSEVNTRRLYWMGFFLGSTSNLCWMISMDMLGMSSWLQAKMSMFSLRNWTSFFFMSALMIVPTLVVSLAPCLPTPQFPRLPPSPLLFPRSSTYGFPWLSTLLGSTPLPVLDLLLLHLHHFLLEILPSGNRWTWLPSSNWVWASQWSHCMKRDNLPLRNLISESAIVNKTLLWSLTSLCLWDTPCPH